MRSIGLDIGTTTVSAVVTENGRVLKALNEESRAFLTTDNAWERIQSPEKIERTALRLLDALRSEYPDYACIGLTGQMHGILYLDAEGAPVSPLYTWQDGRGSLPYDGGTTYAEHLSRLTGYPLSTGFGTVTHYYNLKNGLVPKDAVRFCTVHDFIAMRLSGRTSPMTEASDAASFGVFDLKSGEFDRTALEKAGIPADMYPALAGCGPIGQKEGKPVFAAIGDNQASFIGAVGGDTDAMLVNMGTGGQFSVYTKEYAVCAGLETRPFPGGGYLLVGSSLCGGRAYALWEGFLRSVSEAVTGQVQSECYEAMERLLSAQEKPEGLPVFTPLFQGTREEPTLRASVTGLSPDNLTPAHLTRALMVGMAEELGGMMRRAEEEGVKPSRLVGSGNGLRKNRHLVQCFEEVFGQKMVLSGCAEEAAAGAAMLAAARFEAVQNGTRS